MHIYTMIKCTMADIDKWSKDVKHYNKKKKTIKYSVY